jgi:hypothetical protein
LCLTQVAQALNKVTTEHESTVFEQNYF